MAIIKQYESTVTIIDANAKQVDDVVYILPDTIIPPTPTGNIDFILYQNTAEINRVDKTNFLKEITTILGAFRDATSITELTVVIEYSSLINFNYIYIPIFNRYYFVEDVVCISARLYEISLKVDVLMSYKDALLNLDAFIDRNENEVNENIIDDKRVIEAGYNVESYEVANQIFTKYIGCYLITGLGFNVAEKINSIEESENNVVVEE